MQKLTSTSQTRPKEIVVGKFTVDLNFNVRKIQIPKPGVRHKRVYDPEDLMTAFEYTTYRYSLKEYTELQAEKQRLLKQAIVELADSVLGE